MKDIVFIKKGFTLLVLMILLSLVSRTQKRVGSMKGGIPISKEMFNEKINKYLLKNFKWKKKDCIDVTRLYNTIVLNFSFIEDSIMPCYYELFLEKVLHNRRKIFKKLKAKQIREGVYYSKKYSLGVLGLFDDKNSFYTPF